MKTRTAQRASHRDPAREIDDVLARRTAVSAARLIELIAWINPTDRHLAARETERRYALKSRLQSALIRAHAGDLDVVLDANFPGVVLLHHRALDQGASHVPLDTLDPDARAWAQLQIDLGCALRVARERTPANDVTPSPRLRREPARTPGETPDALRARARAALEQYDYESAEALLREAFDRSEAAPECALALVEFLVDHLAADAEALALEALAAPEARQHPTLRLRWAMAAARLGDAPRALALAYGITNPEAAALHVTLADHHLRAGDLDAAQRRVTDARRLDPARPDLARVADALAQRLAEVFRAQEESLRAAFDQGDLDAADREAHALLLCWPDCASARRVAREVKERRRDALVRAHREAFERALAAGELPEAARCVTALREAGEDVAGLVTRVRETEARLARERKTRDEAAAAPVVALARDGQIEAALGAFLALTDGARAAVRGATPKGEMSDALAWCEGLAREGGLDDAEAVRATVALREAATRLDEAPVEVIAAARPWEEAVHRASETRRLVTRAAQRVSQLAREEALAAFEHARTLINEGRWEEALTAFETMDAAALPNEARAHLDDYVTRLTGALTLERELDPLPRTQGLLGSLVAISLLERFLATVPEPSRCARWTERLEQLNADSRARWHVGRVTEDDPARGAASTPALPGGIAATQPDARWVTVEARAKFLFVRVFDTDTQQTTQRLCVPLPHDFDLAEAHVHEGALMVTAPDGAVLWLDLDRAEVRRWVEFGPYTRGARSVAGHTLASPRTGGFWVATWLTPRTFRYQRFDLGALAVTADLPSSNLAFLSQGSTSEAQILTLDPASERWRISSPEGRLLDVWASDEALTIVAFAPHPARASWLLLVREDQGRQSDAAFTFSLYERGRGRGSVRVINALERESHTFDPSLYVCHEARLAWVVIPLDDGRQRLFCIDLRAGDPREAWRTVLPGRATCVPVEGGRRMVLALSSPVGTRTVALGVEGPPEVGPPSVLRTTRRHCTCRIPGGTGYCDGLVRYYSRRERDELLAMDTTSLRRELIVRALTAEAAVLGLAAHLLALEQYEPLATLLDLADAQYGSAPLVRMYKIERAAHERDWARCVQEARAILDATARPEAVLDARDRAHVAHLYGMALLELGDPDAARDVWTAALADGPSPCGFEGLLHLVDAPAPEHAAPCASPVHRLRAAIATADELLAAGQPAAARDALERSGVLGLDEVQSAARMAEACLAIDDDTPAGRFESLAALARFAATLARLDGHGDPDIAPLNLPLAGARWDAARLDALAARARAVLDLCAVNFGPRG